MILILLVGGEYVYLVGNLKSKIQNISFLDSTARVYNLSVAHHPNYYVGQSGILTHNDGCGISVNLKNKIDEITDVDLQNALRADLNENVALRQALNENPELVEAWEKIQNAPDALRTNISLLNTLNTKKFGRFCSVRVEGGAVKVFSKKGDELAEITNGLVKAKGGRKGSWNQFLNIHPPLKNVIYRIDDYAYYTDALGRVTKVEGVLDGTNRGRLTSQQTGSVDLKDGIKGTDEGGHLIAQMFNGPGEQINYVPQHGAKINREEWYDMEMSWRNLLLEDPNKKIKIRIDIQYQGESLRPTRFRVVEEIDGVKETYNFRNYEN